MKTSKTNINKMTNTALMTAIICVIAPLSVPIGPVPVSFTNFAIYLAVYLIGTRGATASYGLYYLIGLMGMPVFSGFTGGVGKAIGPTGGCLIGFFFMAIISGLFVEKFKSKVLHFVGMLLGTAVVYICAVLWYCLITKATLLAGFLVCVAPFVFIDALKMVFAIMIGDTVRQRLMIINANKKQTESI